jgi:hypothetical protein
VHSARQRWGWAPVWRMPLRAHHLRLRPAAMARQRPQVSTLRPGRMIQVVPADQEGPDLVVLAVPGNTVRADPEDPRVDPVVLAAQADPDTQALTARVGPAVLGTTVRADRGVPVVLGTTVRADREVPVGQGTTVPADREVPVVQAERGMEMTIGVTSTTPRGATDLAPGDQVSHRGLRGIDRSRRREAHGTMARSTTGATRKHPCGIPDSTSGASTSSESGSRCK